MVGIYLSGTGNTKHCIEKITKGLDENALSIPIENENSVDEIRKNDFIILGYPTQFSNAPLMVREFIKKHADLWENKKVLCVATMGAFSGDGAGCTARILKKCDAVVVGGLHLHMPDSVCDSKLLKKTLADNQKIVKDTDKKIDKIIVEMKKGHYPKEGIGIFYHIAGLLGQRLWFYNKTQHYSNKLKFSDTCIGCGLCERNCPMNNIKMENGKPKSDGRCTMCYRCISSCPKQSITLLGEKVQEQCRFEKYI